MAATDPEIKDGRTLPLWLKTKPTREFEPFAASPPAPEESFFYIRYPTKKDMLFAKTKTESDLQHLLTQQTTELNSGVYNGREKDWSKHTKPCQDVLHTIAPINTAVNSLNQKPKPAGTDDGFKDEGAACGTSVVKVAHQMISSTRSSRGFTVASPEEEDAQPPSAQSQYNLRARRGSKSLPTTPNSSPTSRRKNYNRYFTSPFEPTEDGSGRSWLAAALLGFKKDITSSTSTLAEEDALEVRLHGGITSSLAESVESLGPAPRAQAAAAAAADATQQPKLSKPAHPFRPKPSELREMNFWSPTSM